MIVGAPSTSDEGSQSGAAYLIDASTGVQLVRLAPDSLSADDRFGLSVAIHGNIALIGASGDDENGSNAGAVYIYQILENVLTKITPPDAQAGDEFGSSVAIDGPLAVIGA